MSQRVRDVMSTDLVCLAPENRGTEALRYLLSLNIHAAPVLDAEGKPVGVLSLADLLDVGDQERVSDRMSAPARTVPVDADVKAAHEAMADTGFHHLAVVDDSGMAVGFVSAVDLVRAGLGRDVPHPSLSPFYEPEGGLTWSDAGMFEHDAVSVLPQQPGHLLLLAGGQLAWVESCHDLRHRAGELLAHPPDRVVLYLDGGPLQLRVALLPEGHRVLGAKG